MYSEHLFRYIKQYFCYWTISDCVMRMSLGSTAASAVKLIEKASSDFVELVSMNGFI